MLTATEPDLQPGTTGTVTIIAERILNIHFPETPDDEFVEMDFHNWEISPAPIAGWDLQPPSIDWRPPKSVHVSIPVTVADDAPPGEYRYTVKIRGLADGAVVEQVEDCTITVTEP